MKFRLRDHAGGCQSQIASSPHLALRAFKSAEKLSDISPLAMFRYQTRRNEGNCQKDVLERRHDRLGRWRYGQLACQV
jgi:hypothetical protein